MHFSVLAVAACLLSLASALPAPASKNVDVHAQEENSTRPFLVLQVNDDGWMDANLIQLWQELTNAGIKSVISAPPNDVTGVGGKEEDPKPLGDEGCQYESCAPNSPAHGGIASEPAINVSGKKNSITCIG